MILREIKSMYIKNRLTEGVDFVRKEWLKGDGAAYIDTGHNVNENLDYETHVHLLQNTYLFWYRSGSPYIDNTMVVRSNTSVYKGLRIAKNSADVRIGDIADSEVQWNNNKVSINGVDYIPSNMAVSFNYELYLFYAYLKDQPNTAPYTSNNVKCSYFRLLDSNRNYIKNLVPCTLLHSIPRNLDANNRARQAGECGMYDSISGKFYGNVANSGTFTVEGDVTPETHTGLQQIYQNKLIEGVDYETYDWLKYMDWTKPENENSLLGAYLNLNLKVTTRLKVTIKLGETIRINNSDVELIVRSSTRTYYIRRSYFNNNIAVYSPASTMISNNYNLGSNLDFLITEEGLFVNNVQLINEKIEYINQFSNYGRSCTGSISSVTTEEGVDVLVPCTLLRSIPRNLDAQCKERVAGECGMIDLISGKFYGNVANSGTFTVENDNNE